MSCIWECAEFEVAMRHLSENIENSWIQEMNRGQGMESWESSIVKKSEKEQVRDGYLSNK